MPDNTPDDKKQDQKPADDKKQDQKPADDKKQDDSTDKKQDQKPADDKKQDDSTDKKVIKKDSNAIYAALRKNDVSTAKRLLESQITDELAQKTEEQEQKLLALAENYAALKAEMTKERESAKFQQIVLQYGLSEDDVDLIGTDDLDKFQERAKKFSAGRDKQARFAATKSSVIPEDLKTSDLAKRLL